MKKVFLTLAVVALLFGGANAQLQFGVKAGANLANAIQKDADETYSDDFKSKIGFQVGPVVEFGFSDMLSVETGLLLSTKGYRTKDSGTTMGVDWESKGSVNLMYLNIPINARANFELGGINIYGAVGPYVGYLLSAGWKSEMTIDGDTESDSGDLEIGSDEAESDIKPLDFGIGIGAGAAFGAIEVGLNYDLGLANLSPYTDNDTKAANRCFSLTVAYKFGK